MLLKIVPLLLMLLVSGCSDVTRTSGDAVVEGLRPLVNQHSEALQEDGGPKSLVTGARLIKAIDTLGENT